MATILTKIKNRIDTTGNWNRFNPVLLSGEIGFEFKEDQTIGMKVGDGETNFASLPYISDSLRYGFNDVLSASPTLLDTKINNLTMTGSLSSWWTDDDEGAWNGVDPVYDAEENLWNATFTIHGETKTLSCRGGASSEELMFRYSEDHENDGTEHSGGNLVIDMDEISGYYYLTTPQGEVTVELEDIQFNNNDTHLVAMFSYNDYNYVIDEDFEGSVRDETGIHTYSFPAFGTFSVQYYVWKDFVYNPSIQTIGVEEGRNGISRDFYMNLSVGGDGVPQGFSFENATSHTALTFYPKFPTLNMGTNVLHFMEIAPNKFLVGNVDAKTTQTTLPLNTINNLYDAVSIMAKHLGYNVPS